MSDDSTMPGQPAVPDAPAPTPEPPAPPAPPQPTYAAPPQPTYAPPQPAAAVAGPKKERMVAGLLGILLGSLGVHKFYLGYTTEGIIMAAVSIVSLGFLAPIAGIIGLIEGILYLTKPEEEFQSTYVQAKKGWF
jgi:TM2 domain-containing membrane protein YozV